MLLYPFYTNLSVFACESLCVCTDNNNSLSLLQRWSTSMIGAIAFTELIRLSLNFALYLQRWKNVNKYLHY